LEHVDSTKSGGCDDLIINYALFFSGAIKNGLNINKMQLSLIPNKKRRFQAFMQSDI
jgi:hypothetical protein